MPLLQGQVLNNRFRVAKLIGQTDYGAVYRAWDLETDIACALEEILDSSEAAQQAFTRQSQQIVALEHTRLPKFIEAFYIQGKGLYLAMEFVDGEDLQEIFNRADGPLPQEQVLNWASQIGEALSYLHSQNPLLVHGALRPSNVRITKEGQLKLVGLGLAALYDPKTQKMVGERKLLPGYSPPEQYTAEIMDARSDVYALGAILYNLLAGKRLAESVLIKGRDVLAPKAVAEINPKVKPEISNAIMRAIKSDPKERFDNVAEFMAGLRGLPVSVVSEQAAPSSKRWPIIFGGILIVILLLAGLLGIGWFAARYVIAQLSTPTPTASPTPTMTRTPTGTNIPAPSTATSTMIISPTVTAGLADQIEDPFGVSMALVESGPFMMGFDFGGDTERPMHSVTLDDFYIDLYEVTNERYEACVNAGSCTPPLERGSGTRSSYYGVAEYADHPVIYVTWSMAVDYCEYRGARLPTEAEWEKAARGNDQRIFPWLGDIVDCTFANFWGDTPNCARDTTAVGSYPSGVSPYGLFDLAGNVWEWVMDWYGEDYYANSPQDNPQGPSEGGWRVIRGGSWSGGAAQLRVTTRGWNLPNKGYNYVGMRCVRIP